MFFLAGLPQSSELCSELNLLIMLKKIILSLLTALLIVGFSPGALDCAASVSSRFEEGCIDIIVQPRGDVASTSPRMPSATHIAASYVFALDSVYANLSNAGDIVEVEFNNCTTGEHYSFEVPGNGLSVMNIGNSPGWWTVCFTLQSGVVYAGHFFI